MVGTEGVEGALRDEVKKLRARASELENEASRCLRKAGALESLADGLVKVRGFSSVRVSCSVEENDFEVLR